MMVWVIEKFKRSSKVPSIEMGLGSIEGQIEKMDIGGEK